jgi:hypothetical protein
MEKEYEVNSEIVLANAVYSIFCHFSFCCLALQFGIMLAYMLQVTRNQHRLLYYLLFLRMFPMSPNWLINLSCPVLDVPVKTFFITVVLGTVNQFQVSYKKIKS